MQIPEGYKKLATVGMADKGNYSESEIYYYLNTVFYNGSTYAALKDNPEGAPSNDGENWKLVAQGASKNISLESVTFEEALERSNIQSGDTLGDALGKISKTYRDLNNVAFSGSYDDLDDQPDIPSKPEDIGALPENGTSVNSLKWNGFSVSILTKEAYQELVNSGQEDPLTFYWCPKNSEDIEIIKEALGNYFDSINGEE